MRTRLIPRSMPDRLAEPGLAAVSFDVFDTSVVRTYARPDDLFRDLGRLLTQLGLCPLSPERFAHLRVQAERSVQRERGDDVPRLAEIHAELGRRLDWSEEACRQAAATEMVLEREALVAVPRVQGWIAAARAAGKRITFVSDMYLPGTFVRRLLEDLQLAQPGDLVLVSSDERVSKARGGLFDLLIERLGVPADRILHVGDNAVADIAMARTKGLQTQHVTDAALGFLELQGLAGQHDTEGLAGRLAATSRLARLACGPVDPAPALAEIGAGLLGPWLASFALWTLGRARAAGIERLYFVSRDGQVMREISLAVQQRRPETAGIECRYLHGSRLAWHQAAMTALDSRQLRWLLEPQPAVHAGILASRLGLQPEQLTDIFAGTDAATLTGDRPWNAAEIATVAGVLRAKSAEIVARPEIARRRELGRRYLAQEGLRDGRPWAVVEIGWSGSMMISLHEALDRPATLQAYYLNLTSIAPEMPPAVRIESFALGPDEPGRPAHEGLRLAEMIEVLAAADHGTVLGYVETAGDIRPRLNHRAATIWPPARLAELRQGAREFVRQLPAAVMARLAGQLADPAASRLVVHQLRQILTGFLLTPPAALARAFTACRFTEDPTDQAQRRFVQPLRFWPVLRSHGPGAHVLWLQGSLACSPPRVAALVRGGVVPAGLQIWRGLLRRLKSVA